MMPPVVAFGVGGVVGFAILKMQAIREGVKEVVNSRQLPTSIEALERLKKERDEAMLKLEDANAALHEKASTVHGVFSNIQ